VKISLLAILLQIVGAGCSTPSSKPISSLSGPSPFPFGLPGWPSDQGLTLVHVRAQLEQLQTEDNHEQSRVIRWAEELKLS
jgi:hypothetical protein